MEVNFQTEMLPWNFSFNFTNIFCFKKIMTHTLCSINLSSQVNKILLVSKLLVKSFTCENFFLNYVLSFRENKIKFLIQ